MTVPKAVVESTYVLQRKRILLIDAPPVSKLHMPEVDFTPTLAAIESQRYDGGRWELWDVRLYRVLGTSTMDVNIYGNIIDAMPQWLADLVHAEMPRG